ncbi:MAG: hypothetical protein MK101_12660, partial [Phycisphaerales bacterium]|nr:hypothetical protein [Phycisphaerales bacterium]
MRYDSAFWGTAGGRRRAGKRKAADAEAALAEEEQAMSQTRANNVRSLEACRALLVELGDDELRRRLLNSRYNTGGSRAELDAKVMAGRALDDNWVEEAAAAFHVPTKYSKHTPGQGLKTKGNRRHEEVVDDIVRAVQRARRQLIGSAAERDAKRRHQRLEAMRTNQAVRSVAAECGIRGSGDGGFGSNLNDTNLDFAKLRALILVRTCPEELRLSVVEEFVAKEGRLPSGDVPAEEEAHAYVESAVTRRHRSNDTGEQLCMQQVHDWEKLLAQVPEEQRPAWQEDPVFVLALQHHAVHGNLELERCRREDASDEARLADGLQQLRKARYRDVQDKKLFLLRRRLTAQDVLKWEQAFPACTLWDQVRSRGAYIPGSAI